MGADKTATFGIRVDADTNADVAADSIEDLRKRITTSQDAAKNFSAAMRNLRGSSDEVKEAKASLKAAINAERDAVSRASLAIGKHGTTYEAVAKQARDAAKSEAEAAKAAGEAAKKLADGWKASDERVMASAEKMSSAIAGAALGAVAAMAAMAAGAIAGAVSLGKFILEQGSLLRTMGLFREAATGSAENAKAFGHQIDALGEKIPTPRAELNELALSLSKALVNTRVSGQGIVDTFNAVAQESSAMGDTAGKALETIISRGKLFGRIGIGINELQGTGLQFTDVASQLAANLKISIGAAQMQLRMGRVKVDAGAKAIRDVVEKRFGGVNKNLMLDLNTQAKKFQDRLQHLTEGVNLEKVLAGFERLSKLFDTSTVTGAALKDMITRFGTGLGDAFDKALPTIEEFFTRLVTAGLRVEIAWMKLQIQLNKTFGKGWADGLNVGGFAMDALRESTTRFAAVLQTIGKTIDLIHKGWLLIKGDAGQGGISATLNSNVATKDGGMKSFRDGQSTADGFSAGLDYAAPHAASAAKAMAEGAKDSLRDALKIHSPSEVFAGYGAQTVAGYAQGVDAAAPKAQDAIVRMAPTAPASAVSSGKSPSPSAASVAVTVSLNFPHAKSGKEVSAALTNASFRAQFTKLLEEACVGAGVPTQQAAT